MPGSNGEPPNDMHPPNNVLYALEFVAEVYNDLRRNEEVWSKTLFMITCDEGVGIFDHVPPPPAKDPARFPFTRPFVGQTRPNRMSRNPFEIYGTRVPMIIASPFVEAGSVIRPDESSEYPFDHTSIIRTVFDLFCG